MNRTLRLKLRRSVFLTLSHDRYLFQHQHLQYFRTQYDALQLAPCAAGASLFW